MKRYALVLTLVMALAAGFGCAKKTTTEPGYDDGMSPEMRAAVQQISDSRVYFAFNKYNIENQYDAVLKKEAEILKQFPTIRVRIEGNCDDRGTQEYNLALGERRARAAYEYLVQNGVNPSQLEMISYGKENPAVQGTGEAVWAKNRRDDFRVIAH
ncbi:peptidoglycan-associated lipoprotein Pal [uncultured Desulfovibrio sp.]|uniref:peptidoglycan-associated lipoprotein Pal n=1 Tax=uncultured Desulfovibrio sp. TaxID=167968 RepID=UPI0025E26EF3|nr:peptidoglycan-associated lipoprotein Pal [uncultured Desulfovibrio sp.]